MERQDIDDELSTTGAAAAHSTSSAVTFGEVAAEQITTWSPVQRRSRPGSPAVFRPFLCRRGGRPVGSQ